MSPDPIFHPHMSPYVGMDDNPVALCDPYGLATGGDGGRPNWKTKPVSKQSKKTNARVFDGSSESSSGGKTKLGKFFDKIGDFAESVGEGLAKAGKVVGKHVEESFESSGGAQSDGGGGGNDPQSKVSLPADLSKYVGTDDYYIKRHEDFISRYPDKTPPSYYLNYGHKYMMAFRHNTRWTLSLAGQEWLDQTLIYLQQAIENKLKSDPSIELDEQGFTNFAFRSHVGAYTHYYPLSQSGGILGLHPLDKVKIMLTVEPEDLVASKSMEQITQVMALQNTYYYFNETSGYIHTLSGVLTSPFIALHIAKYWVNHSSGDDKITKAYVNLVKQWTTR